MEYMGPKKIVESLNSCKRVQELPLLGCTSGVFMEYNFPTVEGASADPKFQTRQLSDATRYSPCDTIPTIFKESCYFELSKWWNASAQKQYLNMQEWCLGAPDAEYRESCIMGIGTTMVEAGWNTKEVSATCARMSDSRSTMLCLSGASWGFFQDPKTRDLASDLCQNAYSTLVEECKTKAALTNYPKWQIK